jgi:uncharacterized protein YuzE
MSAFKPHATYSESADAVYVYLGEGDVSRSRILDDRRIIDLAEDGHVLGIEFLDASDGLDLRDTPFKQEVGTLVREFKFPVLDDVVRSP